MKKDLLDLTSFNKEEILDIIHLADKIKHHPGHYSQKMKGKTLLMIFEKPSLRTRVSFEVGMTRMGGHAIYYNISTSPMGKKESVADTAKVVSRYVDIIMARLFAQRDLIEMADNSSVPVINALTDFAHPCQILADLQTIREKKGTLQGLKLTYFGDAKNNVTHSLLYGCSLLGMDISVGCPQGSEYEPLPEVLQKAREIAQNSGARITLTYNAQEAVRDADIIYTDSWMSYHIPEEQKERRKSVFMPYQVNSILMSSAKPGAVFMNCLPAMREMEQTAEVIDGPQSIVFDQAENRLHVQKALMLKLLKME